MKSPVVKRSIVVAGHKTSVSLEEAFWNGMKEISGLRNMTLSELVGEIDGNRQQGNLSSAIRLFVLDYFRNRAIPAGGRGRTQPGRRPEAIEQASAPHAPARPIASFNRRGRCRAAFRAPPTASDIPRSRCRRSRRSG